MEKGNPPPREGGNGEFCMGIPPYGPKELVRPSLLLPSIADCKSFGLLKLCSLHSSGYKYFVYLKIVKKLVRLFYCGCYEDKWKLTEFLG